MHKSPAISLNSLISRSFRFQTHGRKGQEAEGCGQGPGWVQILEPNREKHLNDIRKKRALMPPVKPGPPRPAPRAARIVKFQAYYPVPRAGTVLPGGAWAHLVTAPAPRLDLSTTSHECEPRQPPPRHLNKWGGGKGRGGALLSTSDHHAFLLSAGAVSKCARSKLGLSARVDNRRMED